MYCIFFNSEIIEGMLQQYVRTQELIDERYELEFMRLDSVSCYADFTNATI